MNEGAGIEATLVLIVIADLVLLGSSRLTSCIRLVALQGIAVGILPLLMLEKEGLGRAVGLAGGIMMLKGVIFPWLLARVLRDSGARREVEPFVGLIPSILAGVAALAFSLWVIARLPLAGLSAEPLMVPVGLATLLIGLFVIVSRRKAVSQVIGYIVVENGIFLFGTALVGDVPMLVELGVLMDAFVAVFIMGIAAYHISREFDHINVDRLDRLKG